MNLGELKEARRKLESWRKRLDKFKPHSKEEKKILRAMKCYTSMAINRCLFMGWLFKPGVIEEEVEPMFEEIRVGEEAWIKRVEKEIRKQEEWLDDWRKNAKGFN